LISSVDCKKTLQFGQHEYVILYEMQEKTFISGDEFFPGILQQLNRILKKNLPENLYKLCLLGIILKLSGDFLKLINSD
jgi:hypothetical protein